MALKRIKIGPTGADYMESPARVLHYSPDTIVSVAKNIADNLVARSLAVPVKSGGQPEASEE